MRAPVALAAPDRALTEPPRARTHSVRWHRGEHLIAFVAGVSVSEDGGRSWASLLADALAEEARPDWAVRLDPWPVNVNGKVRSSA